LLKGLISGELKGFMDVEVYRLLIACIQLRFMPDELLHHLLKALIERAKAIKPEQTSKRLAFSKYIKAVMGRMKIDSRRMPTDIFNELKSHIIMTPKPDSNYS
jgi:hypothetical protein